MKEQDANPYEGMTMTEAMQFLLDFESNIIACCLVISKDEQGQIRPRIEVNVIKNLADEITVRKEHQDLLCDPGAKERYLNQEEGGYVIFLNKFSFERVKDFGFFKNYDQSIQNRKADLSFRIE